MKLVITLLFLASAALASPLNSLEQARSAKQIIKRQLAEYDGVNGIGIGFCDPQTGYKAPPQAQEVEYCVQVDATTKVAFNELCELYPLGSRVKGVFVYFILSGKSH